MFMLNRICFHILKMFITSIFRWKSFTNEWEHQEKQIVSFQSEIRQDIEKWWIIFQILFNNIRPSLKIQITNKNASVSCMVTVASVLCWLYYYVSQWTTVTNSIVFWDYQIQLAGFQMQNYSISTIRWINRE